MQPGRFALLTLASLALPAAGQAQQVVADISIAGGPVSGRIIVGDPYPRYHRTYVERRHRPAYHEVIVIRGHRGHGWYRNQGYRVVRVYYDRGRNSFYDRPYHSGLRAIVVYERGGRYYADRDYRFDRDDYRRGGNDRNDHRRGDDDRNDYRKRVDDRGRDGYDDRR